MSECRVCVIVALLAVWGCHWSEPDPTRDPEGWSEAWFLQGRAVMQTGPSTLSAFEPNSGELAWTLEIPAREQSDVIKMPPPRLVCSPVVVGDGAILVRVEGARLDVAADTGTVIAHQRVPPVAEVPSRRFPRGGAPATEGDFFFCPTATPDGGYAAFDVRGHRLVKHDAGHRERWSWSVREGERADARARALPEPEGLVVKTTQRLVALDVAGTVRWSRDLSSY